MNVHLILYSNNDPFDITKKLIIDSINEYSKNNIIIHDYNLEKIMNLEWFYLIKDLPSIDKLGRRDGYYNSWKPLIVRDVFNKMFKGDILYYVDCSQYFIEGFNNNIDKLCEISLKKGIIAGSIGRDCMNSTWNVCNNLSIWNKIIHNNDNRQNVNKPHVLNSWFLLSKNNLNSLFINEWIYYCFYTDNEFKDYLITYNHTVDQSIFNILVVKYKLPVFYSKNIGHNQNKNKNLVLNVINNNENTDEYFVTL